MSSSGWTRAVSGIANMMKATYARRSHTVYAACVPRAQMVRVGSAASPLPHVARRALHYRAATLNAAEQKQTTPDQSTATPSAPPSTSSSGSDSGSSGRSGRSWSTRIGITFFLSTAAFTIYLGTWQVKRKAWKEE